MIFKNEIELIRLRMTDTILSTLGRNRKYISTYYTDKQKLSDRNAYKPYDRFIYTSFGKKGDVIITDIYLEKTRLKFDYIQVEGGLDSIDYVDALQIESLFSIVKWLQQYNYLDDILQIKHCYFCGKTDLQKLAWVDANAENKFIEFYDENDNNVYCNKCQRNTSYLEYSKTNVPVELINHWFNSVSVNILEDITGLSMKTFKNEIDHLEFRAKCNQFWEMLSEITKRNLWIRFREI